MGYLEEDDAVVKKGDMGWGQSPCGVSLSVGG